MRKIAIIGSGDLANQITHYAETDLSYEVVGFFDDFINKGDIVNGKVILGGSDLIVKNFKLNVFDSLVIGIGYRHLDFRASIFEKFYGNIPFENLIHSSCSVDTTANIGAGVVLFPNSIIDMNVTIGNNVLLNIDCAIAHDTKIGNHSFLSPSVKIAGFCNVGEKCNLGINTTIIDNIFVTNNVQTGGGTVVISAVDKSGLYVGNPQRHLR